VKIDNQFFEPLASRNKNFSIGKLHSTTVFKMIVKKGY
jgi:hypothetical protein